MGCDISVMEDGKSFEVPLPPEKEYKEKVALATERALNEKKTKLKTIGLVDPISYDDPKKYELIKKFLQRKKLKLYGGAAINMWVGEEDKFYSEDDIPDYDIYSPNPWVDAVELAEYLYKNGFLYTEVRSGIHAGTYKVFSNLYPVADLSYVPPDIYKKIPVTKKEGFLVANPEYLHISIYREFQEVLDNPERWEKIAWRQKLLEKWQPVRYDQDCKNIVKEQKQEYSKELRIINSFVRKNKLLRFGVDAFNKYMELGGSKKQIELVYYQALSENANEKILELQSLIGGVVETIYCPYKEIFNLSYKLKLGDKIIAEFVNMDLCVPYKIFDEDYYVSVDHIKYWYHLEKIVGDKKISSCILKNLAKVQERYYKEYDVTEFDDSPFQRFVTDCIGPYQNKLKHTLLGRWQEREKQREKIKQIKPKKTKIKIKGAQGKTIKILPKEENPCAQKRKKECAYPCRWDYKKDKCFDIPAGIYKIGEEDLKLLSSGEYTSTPVYTL